MTRILIAVTAIAMATCFAGCATRQDRPWPIFVKDTDVIVVGKVDNVYPFEWWDEERVGRSNGVTWHIDMVIDTPEEWRGLRPHFTFPPTGDVDYGRLLDKVVSIRLTPEQAQALFIRISPGQLREGRDPDARPAILDRIKPEYLLKK